MLAGPHVRVRERRRLRKQNASRPLQIPGNPLRSFDISWVNPDRAEYYLADRSNSGIDVIDTQTLKFKRTIGGFVGVVNSMATGTA